MDIDEPPPARSFLPALRFRFATGAYDPVVRWTTREAAVKAALASLLAASAGQRIVDVGCGTGTLAISIAAGAPGAQVVGIDADGDALALASAKQDRAGTAVRWQRAFAQRLPFAAGTFDAAVSSLFFHHLERAEKRRVLSEIHRVVRAGGRLVIADWGPPATVLSALGFLAVRALDGFGRTRDSVEGMLPRLIEEAGFDRVVERARYNAPLGTVSLYSAVRAEGTNPCFEPR